MGMRETLLKLKQKRALAAQTTPASSDLVRPVCPVRPFASLTALSAKSETMKRVTIACHKEDSNRLDRWLKSSGYYRKMKSHTRVESSMLERMIFLALRSEGGKIDVLRAAAEIYDRGVYVNPTLPPATPEGEALLRTSYMATHTEVLLDEAMDIIGEVMAHE